MKTYPKIIKKIIKNDIELCHYIQLDDFGFERDFFEMIKYGENGRRYILPFLPKIVVNNYSKDEPIKFTNEYTDENYEEMFYENSKLFL